MHGSVDPSPHLPLINRVITQMGITDREEAFSEGLVAITVAAQKYDPSKGVPLANWLGKNIRWSLQNWRENARKTYTVETATLDALESVPVTSIENLIALREAFGSMDKILTTTEKTVLLLHAMDWPGIKIAEHLGITNVAVTRLKHKAQQKMREALLEIPATEQRNIKQARRK